MKRRRKILLWVLAALMVAAVFPIHRHYRLKARLERYRQELRARGEKLTVAEVFPPATNQSGAAAAFLLTAEQLPDIAMDSLPATMEFLSPGRARVTWACTVLPTERTADRWPEIQEHLAQAREPLAALRSMLKESALQFEPTHPPELNRPGRYANTTRTVAHWFTAAAIHALHNGEAASAQENVEACLAIVNQWQNEPLINADLTRCAIGTLALNATWEALHYPGWTDAQLARFQAAWEATEFVPDPNATLAAERAYRVSLIAARREQFMPAGRTYPTRTGFGEFTAYLKFLTDDFPSGLEVLRNRYPQYWAWKWWGSYEEELRLLKDWQSALEQVRQLREQNSFAGIREALALAGPDRGAEGRTGRGGPNANRAERFVRRWGAMRAAQGLVVTAIALERYELKHGHFPRELSELVPDYLSAVPRDTGDDRALRYRLNPDGTFLLYSVGDDGEDHQGDPTGAEQSGYRPFFREVISLYGGRDWVWPAPADSEELRVWEAAVAERRTLLSGQPTRRRPRAEPHELSAVFHFVVDQLGLKPIHPADTNNPASP